MLSKAISITAEAFIGKYDKGGKPYILHCIHVMRQMPQDDLELQQIAVLHDLIEDTDYTIYDLGDLGFSDRVLYGVTCLTHDEFVDYDEYIKGISINPDAVLVKMADLRHNSDVLRMKGVRDKDLERIKKYHKAYSFLKGVRDDR